ncbi:phage tail family protein [Neobacillus sp. WH10]|uniref:distal tail protein Dit n=1 Tax=Neobacillus sp. WH10 TaxID=3047873 RepID=UPI0024C2037A|nr:distal tail protein Dit [Neobacillus sp. WH10]WHY75702.1 phage tail family protein [Neobacillus sp. WH10]
MSGMTFNGIRKPYVTVLRGRKRPSWAPIKRNILTIPGMAGGLLESTDILPRPEDVPILIKGNDMADLQKIKEDLAAWLITDQPAPLIFDDEPDRIYNAMIDGSIDLEEIIYYGQGVLNFICPDPYKYGPEKQANFQSSSTVNVSGSAKTFPNIKVNITKDTTFVAVSNGEKLNLIGNPTKQEETPYSPESTVLTTTGNNLTGWTNSSATSIEGFTQLGTLKANGDFYTDDYGVLTPGWHGPAMKTSLGQSLQDFRLDVGFNMAKTGNNQAGGLEVSLLSASSTCVAKVGMTKHYGGLDQLYAKVRAGTSLNGYDVIAENQARSLNSIQGIFRVIRKGNVWTAQLFYYSNYSKSYQLGFQNSWIDSENKIGAAVTQVQVALMQRGEFPVVNQRVSDINVFKINSPIAGQVSIIAKAGDVIEFDHTTDNILKNGIPFLKEKVFIGEYFSLSPGVNAILAEPADSISSTEVRWRDRWR